MPDSQQDRAIAEAVAEWVAERCGLTPGEVDRDRPFFDFGLSSVDALELVGGLEERLGRPLPPTLLWEHPTVNSLAAALTPSTEPQPYQPARRVSGDGIAVIGLGCRLPGEVDGPDALWRLLIDGRDAVGAVAPGHEDTFDPFGAMPGEVPVTDPQQRILLEVAAAALRHAALDPGRLRGTRTGVYVGMCAAAAPHHSWLGAEGTSWRRVNGWTPTGSALSIAANRLSYLLDLRGPSLAVDTAGSSSLVAAHLAGRALRAGETELALVGGVNLLLAPAVRAEGCGVVVLKRLADAVRDGDRVLAVLRGSAVNSDGRSNRVTRQPRAQELLLRDAYADAGLEPSEVDYVETHVDIVGLAKAVLALHHGEVPPGHPARAGVSAFGSGGTNAHLVLEQYID